MFLGIEDILMAVIKNIGLDEDNEKHDSHEERLEKTLKVLFGTAYEKAHSLKIPSRYSQEELQEIIALQEKGPRAKAIKTIVERHHPVVSGQSVIERVAAEATRERLIQADCDAIKQQIYRDKRYYLWIDPLLPYTETEEEIIEDKKKIDNILQSLKEAGWPIE